MASNDLKEQRFIQNSWEEYQLMVLPKNAPAIQISETKLGFFAGAQAMWTFLTDMAASLPEDQACELMSSLSGELKTFQTLYVASGKVP